MASRVSGSRKSEAARVDPGAAGVAAAFAATEVELHRRPTALRESRAGVLSGRIARDINLELMMNVVVVETSGVVVEGRRRR